MGYEVQGTAAGGNTKAKYIFRPTITVKNNRATITYHNSQGKNITYKPGNQIENSNYNACLLFETVSNYFTANSPNITPAEQVKIRAEIAKGTRPISAMASSTCGWTEMDLMGGIDYLLKTFSDDASDGGKNITPNEVYQMFEIFHQWTK